MLLTEISLRGYEYYISSKTIYELDNQQKLSPGSQIDLAQMLRVSSFNEIVYELIPDLHVYFLGAQLSTNESGFRGRAYPTKKSTKTVRVVGIGDSLMFGWGVADDETYLNLLERKLENSGASLSWEVINTAVPGYNTALEVATLKSKALAYAPDIVVLGFVESNDLELPHFVRRREAAWVFDRSYVLDLLRGNLVRSSIVSTLARPSAKEQSRYKAIDNLRSLENSLETLRMLSQEHEFEVIVYAHERLSKEVRNLFLTKHLRLVEAWPSLLDAVDDANVDSYRSSHLVLSTEDPHPSAAGHALAAELLYYSITDSSKYAASFDQMSSTPKQTLN